MSQNFPQHLPVKKNLVIARVMTLQHRQLCGSPQQHPPSWHQGAEAAQYLGALNPILLFVHPVGGDLYWTPAVCQPRATEGRKSMHRLPDPILETSLRDGNQTLQAEAAGRFDVGHRETGWGMYSTYREVSVFC